jgi:hypothetical protein
MKMIPMPEVGDKVILKPTPAEGDLAALPELTTKVILGEDSVIYDAGEDNWQISVEPAEGGDGEDEILWNVTWDEEAKAWRDV